MLIISDRSEHVRLKSYGAVTKGKVSVVTIAVEVTDTFELSMLLRELESLSEATKAAKRHVEPKAEPKPRTQRKLGHQQMLALPAPQRDDA